MTALNANEMPVSIDRTINARRLMASFFWKECRRLTPMAIGVAVLGLLVMLTLASTLPPQDISAAVQIVAWGATALLAVACAVTLYAVEEEEGTVDFLRYLPRNQSAVFMAKVLAAIVVLIATVVLLSLIGLRVSGGLWPERTGFAIGLFSYGGMAVAEAFVWSLLASLLIRQPLIAAVVGIATASVCSQIAMLVVMSDGSVSRSDDFRNALLSRAAIVGLVAIVAGWRAMHWPRVAGHVRSRRPTLLDDTTTYITARTSNKRKQRAPFARLIWQTVRQSWKTALIVVVVGLFLPATIGIIGFSFNASKAWLNFAGWLGCSIIPALLGAMVFRADRHRDQYRFLAEHAGGPRLLWLARHVTFLLPMVATAVCMCLLLTYLAAKLAPSLLMERLPWLFYGGTIGRVEAAAAQVEVGQMLGFSWYLVCIAAGVAFAAYGFGQFFSLLLKSDVLAAGLAVLMSILITGWASAVITWRLSPLWFVGLLGAGAMLATLLRVRSWMFDQNGLRHWLLPLLAVVFPLVLIALMVPVARHQQVEPGGAISNRGQASFDSKVRYAERGQEQGRELEHAYRNLAVEIAESEENIITTAQQETFVELSEQHARLPITLLQLRNNAFAGVNEASAAASDRMIEHLIAIFRDEAVVETKSDFLADESNGRLIKYTFESDADLSVLEARLERLLACLRTTAQVMNGRPVELSANESYLSDELLDWAMADDQTPELILEAIEQLRDLEKKTLPPSKRLMNDFLHTRAIIRGEELPSFLSGTSQPTPNQWMLSWASQLPGEPARGEQALEVMALATAKYLKVLEKKFTIAAIDKLAAPQARMYDELHGHHLNHAGMVERVDLATRWDNSTASQRAIVGHLMQPLIQQAKTSYLVTHEFVAPQEVKDAFKDWANMIAWRRAERVRLALIAYRLREGEYPENLDALSPDYLKPHEYHDPYTTGSFGYAPQGFATPLWHGGQEIEIESVRPMLWCAGIENSQSSQREIRIQIDEETAKKEYAGWGYSGERFGEYYGDSPDEEPHATETVTLLETSRKTVSTSSFWMPLPR